MGNETKGMLIGAVGVLIFSLTLPFTRICGIWSGAACRRVRSGLVIFF
jgi:hypothetical protein